MFHLLKGMRLNSLNNSESWLGVWRLQAALMDDFRGAAEAVGQCLHLNYMGGNHDGVIAQQGVNSITDYGWVKYGSGPGCVHKAMDGCLVRQTFGSVHFWGNVATCGPAGWLTF
jgi:hypothetical protein